MSGKKKKIIDDHLTHEACEKTLSSLKKRQAELHESYEKLLSELKKRHAEFITRAKELELDEGARYVANQKAWEKWIDDNVTSRGLSYMFDQRTGEPKMIFRILAGESSSSIGEPSCF